MTDIHSYIQYYRQATFHPNPLLNLTPESLKRTLKDFEEGKLKPAAQLWDVIEQRDPLLQGLISKRKKAIARLNWAILPVDNSPEALQHKKMLEDFYNNATCINAYDQNVRGGIPLLIFQMMDAVGKQYAVHEIVWKKLRQNNTALLTAEFRFVPLFFFENIDGQLQFIAEKEHKKTSVALNAGEWVISYGDGLMKSCSVNYLYKTNALHDWITYAGRNGMPIIKGVTQARPGSPEWENACEAVRNCGPECHVLTTQDTEIEVIPMTNKQHELPYPQLIEYLDRAMVVCWSGSDTDALTKENGTGVSNQRNAYRLLMEDDAQRISDILNAQVDPYVIGQSTGAKRAKAYFHLTIKWDHINDIIEKYQTASAFNLPVSESNLREDLSLPKPATQTDTLTLSK